MRRFLAEFLSDPLVIGLPRFLWLPVLHGLVLNTRPGKTAEKYRQVWTPEGSPLAVHTMRQTALLRKYLPDKRVEFAMRYGGPGVREVKDSMPMDTLVLPLYPQYADSTTGSVLALLSHRQPAVRDFHDHPAYIGALASLVEKHWAAHGRGGKLVMSFHGLPQRAVDRGDPYRTQCLATAALLAAKLGLKDDYLLTFQSRFGAAKWLQPYTEPTLVSLAERKIKRVDVICPGFVSDCLETLEEIGITARQAFLRAGGGEFHLLPCLNESPEWIAALAAISGRKGP